MSDYDIEEACHVESSPRPTPEEEVTCLICMEETCDSIYQDCGHSSFCRECVKEHCAIQITSRRSSIECPHHSCHTIIPVTLLNSILDSNLRERYDRLRQMANDSTLIECPRCDNLVRTSSSTSTDQRENDRSNNGVLCESCELFFCRIHGQSHAGMSCTHYLQTETAKANAATEATIQLFTKECEKCHAALFKASGCDHVVCVNCSQDMCWKCGTGAHLTGTSVRKCSQCNHAYRDHRYDGQYQIRLCFCLPMLFLAFVIYMACAFLFFVLSAGFCCCFYCGKGMEAPYNTPRSSISFGCLILFLPVIAVLSDFGFRLRVFDDLLTDSSTNELPTMTPVIGVVPVGSTSSSSGSPMMDSSATTVDRTETDWTADAEEEV